MFEGVTIQEVGLYFIKLFGMFIAVYIAAKAKGLASKEDIKKITTQVKQVEQSFNVSLENSKTKNQLLTSKLSEYTNRKSTILFDTYKLGSIIPNRVKYINFTFSSIESNDITKMSELINNVKDSLDELYEHTYMIKYIFKNNELEKNAENYFKNVGMYGIKLYKLDDELRQTRNIILDSLYKDKQLSKDNANLELIRKQNEIYTRYVDSFSEHDAIFSKVQTDFLYSIVKYYEDLEDELNTSNEV